MQYKREIFQNKEHSKILPIVVCGSRYRSCCCCCARKQRTGQTMWETESL